MISPTPHIWVPRTKIIEPRDPLIVGVTAAGLFRLRTIRPGGGVVKDTGWFPNLITNTGLDMFGSGSSLNRAYVGTGNSTPNVTDTALNTQVAYGVTTQSQTWLVNQGGDARYCQMTSTERISAPGSAHNLAEVGYGSSSTLFSRALILNSEGIPTTISWGADEALDVTYALRIYPPVDDYFTTMTVAGVDYDVTIRASTTNAWGAFQGGLGASIFVSSNFAGFSGATTVYNGTIGAVTSSPSGAYAGTTSTSASSYVTGTYFREGQAIFGLTAGNVPGGITAFRISFGRGGNGDGSYSYGRHFQLGITGGGTGAIPKTESQNMSIGWRTLWSRRSI